MLLPTKLYSIDMIWKVKYNSAKEDGFFDGTFIEDLKNLTSHS